MLLTARAIAQALPNFSDGVTGIVAVYYCSNLHYIVNYFTHKKIRPQLVSVGGEFLLSCQLLSVLTLGISVGYVLSPVTPKPGNS